MYSLTIEDSNGQIAEQFSFDHGSYLIGRQESCDIVLPSPSVSRQHAKIFVEDGRCYIEDLNSANGVTVDGQRVVKQRHLGTASQVRVGDYYLYLEYQGNEQLEDQNVRQTLFIDDSPDHHKLIRVNDDFAGEEFSLSEVENTIGRTDDNYILLSDPSISRQHAKIIRDGENYTLLDLGSSNGTRLNGEEVLEPSSLNPGDQIEFGNVQFVFAHGDEQINPADYATEDSGPNNVQLASIVALLVLAGVAIGLSIAFGLVSFKGAEADGQTEEVSQNLDSEAKAILEDGKQHLDDHEWDQAIESFYEVLAVAPDNSEAKRLREKARQEKDAEKKRQKGIQLSQDGKFEKAFEKLNAIPEKTVAADRAETTLKHVGKTVAERLLKKGKKEDLRKAQESVIRVLEIAPDDEEATQLLKQIEEKMKEQDMEFEAQTD